MSVTVIVTNAIAQPPQPVKAAHVSLTHLISAQPAVDAQGPTNPRGEAQLLISQSAAKNGGLRIVISGVSNLVIYDPADGQLSGLKSPVRVLLLPKGSFALLGPAQIQAYLRRLLLEVNSLQKQVSTLKTEAAQGQGQQQYLTSALADFAQATGFPHDQVDQQVAIWAQSIKLQAARATTAEQKALAAFALKNYAAAAEDYKQAADATREQINGHEASAAAHERARENEVDAARNDLRQLINQCQAAAGADQLNLKYHDATETLESAVATADAEAKKHPNDKDFHELWLQAVSEAASARSREGEVAPADQSLPLLAQSATDFDSLVREYAALGDRQAMAAAEDGLGNALEDEGERASGDKAAAFFDESVQAFQKALEVRTKADLPKDWAVTQNDLGIALESEGERASADKATAFFDQAVQAFHQALDVITKANLPQDWAKTQFNLGIALTQEGQHALGANAAALLDAAVHAFGKALEVDTKADLPQRWAITQDALGLALMEEGLRSNQAGNAALLDQAVQAFKSALEVITRDALPQTWAQIQNNLGSALENEGIRASDEKAPDFFDQAALAYQNALEVYTKADLPQDWGRAQINLGLTWMQEGLRTSGDRAGPLLAQSVQAFENSLEVFTKADLPQYWATAQLDLGDALASEALHTGGDKAPALFDQAIQAYQRVLEVETKADLPEDWAETQMNIMEVSFMAARYSTCIQRMAIVTDDALSRPQAVVRDTIELACQWGAGDRNAARQTEKALLSKSATLEASVWDFTGSLQILSNSPAFANGRASWVALFTAVQNGDSAGMTAALHQLEPILQQ
jgi:tetratricopeptide (TPR) repeat protein